MRVDATSFAVKNAAAAKSPRFVVKIEFTSALYLSSHNDITGVPSTHIPGCLIAPSVSSQKLNPDQGRAEIGAASFSVADVDSALTDALRARLSAGEGIRGRICRFYLGYEGDAFSDFILFGSQIVTGTTFDKGAYQISCNDIQRSARKDVFTLASTTISTTVEAADTTINVYSTSGFSTVKHGTSYSDAASSTVGYIKIKDEVIRYTGTTATSFTGCTRGVLGTSAARYLADGATAAARREKVSEYVYLELPGPKLAYALLTGVLHGDTANLPSSWHLGIPTSLVKLSDFTGIGPDLWDTASDANGIILRFEGIQKTDGKAFLELEVMRLLGLYMPVYSTGELGLRRMTRVLADASGLATLDETNSVMVGDLEHDLGSLHNAFFVYWNWNGKDYTRTTTYLDATSVATHGRADDMDLKFKGLYGGRHTDGVIFKLLDGIRDRYSAPPCRLQVDVFHSLNTIEVGDVVRVRHANLRDFAGSGESIDRAFEVQSVSVNHRTGVVSLDLLGSTSNAAITSPTTSTTSLPDAFYTAQGTNLSTVMTITSGVVSGGPYTLTGGTDITAGAATWYYSGDLTIPAGVTVNITGNVQLRVKGYLTVNGTITGIGGGLAGVADNGTTTPTITGTPGWVGNSRGLDGLIRTNFNDRWCNMKTFPVPVTVGKNPSFPYISLEVSGSTIKGLPTDLRGTGGGPGGKYVHKDSTFYKNGGTGAAGGAGLCLISRGLGVGANASINLSGANSSAPTAYVDNDGNGHTVNMFPGTGGAGGPGSLLVLIDGSLLSVPDLAGRFVARTGTVGVPSYTTALQGTTEQSLRWYTQPFAGFLADPSVISGLDLSFSCQRIQFIPASETAAVDTTALAPVENLTISSNSSGYVVVFTPASGTPLGTIFEVWDYTSSTPFSSATKRAEGAATAFFIPRNDTTTVYCWVRARYTNSVGQVFYSATSPAGSGVAAAAAAVAGAYATASPSSIAGTAASSSVTTGTVTAALVGATATTYSWARQSGSTSISANSASAAATTFTGTGIGTGATISAVFRCTINSTYTVDVTVSCTNNTSTLALSASPTSLTKAANTSSITTASTTATASGGSGGNSFAWAKVSGGTITANTATSATTTFTATGLTVGETRTATFRCTVTDSSSATATADVNVSITYSAVTATITPASVSKTGTTPNLTTASVTASATGGTGPYTYSWSPTSSGGISVNSPSLATTSFTATGLADPEIRTGTFVVTATDSNSPALTDTQSISVTIERDSGI